MHICSDTLPSHGDVGHFRLTVVVSAKMYGVIVVCFSDEKVCNAMDCIQPSPAQY